MKTRWDLSATHGSHVHEGVTDLSRLRLPPVVHTRRSPMPKLAVIGLLACIVAGYALSSPWVVAEGVFGPRELAAADTREGEVMLTCMAIAGFCFVLMMIMRSSILMLPALLALSLSLGLGITALRDPGAFVTRTGVLSAGTDVSWGMYVTVGAGVVALLSAFVVGWDHRKL